MKALIVDGDQDLLDVMAYALRREGYHVLTATTGQQALDQTSADRPDIVLLELKLERVDGFEVCRRIRLEFDTPIIVVTSSYEEADVLRALKLGADDYVTKPFSLKQLAARMEAVLRRRRADSYARAVRTVKAGDLELRLQSYEVTRRGGEPIQLTPLEFRILYILAMNEGQIIPYSRIVDYAWGFEGGDSSLLKTHICHVRAKLDLPVSGPGSIRALATVGYSLVRRPEPKSLTASSTGASARGYEERARPLAG